jgi:hypothetical protein
MELPVEPDGIAEGQAGEGEEADHKQHRDQ